MVDAPARRSYSRTLLVRWLSGRKQRFAKAPYSKRVPRVRIPPSPPAFTPTNLGTLLQALFVRALEIRTPFDWWGALRARVKIPPERDHSPEPKRSFG